MTTELLYLRDAYLREFDARVVEVRDGEVVRSIAPRSTRPAAGNRTTRARSTARYVSDVRKEGDVVWHTVDGDLPAVGDEVHGVIDWERRHRLMRTHSALHVLCGVIWNEWGKAVTGGNMEPLEARMDFEFDPLPEGFAGDGGRSRERGDRGRLPDRGVVPAARHRGHGDADLIRTKVNMIPESVTEIRVVDIVGLDKQADGGTHVRSTGEIGRFEVVKTEKKDNKRFGSYRPKGPNWGTPFGALSPSVRERTQERGELFGGFLHAQVDLGRCSRRARRGRGRVQGGRHTDGDRTAGSSSTRGPTAAGTT